MYFQGKEKFMSNELINIDSEKIDLIVYDFDGVMTDNKVIISDDGKESVVVNRSDGLAISKIKEMKIPQLILSSETNNIVKIVGDNTPHFLTEWVIKIYNFLEYFRLNYFNNRWIFYGVLISGRQNL